ncbi:Putative acyltransferase [Rheinheimera sp. A13L]|uniref:acyltransferase family protein n=1 Tax=Rheinheimera sp. A13L TaxID=506534 RepID=UPI00021254A0|nr:acyltransferase family protein [Rheinheimera sp. A13L]EGM78156.1 Putative acyltransferase [Rheinheimera sp. A13L]
MDYRKEIDGLRAVAVLSVMFFHTGFSFFSGGFIGVDIFFVISGYLITTIILKEMEAGNFSLIQFYERRARRILPALFLVLFISLPFAWLWLIPQDLKPFSQSLVAVSTFSSNIFFWISSDYFDTAAELKPLLHTWSLAVEEQFYFAFPILMMFTWCLGKRWVVGLLSGIFLFSLLLADFWSTNNPTSAFYLLPARCWELLAGSFIAFYSTSSLRRDVRLCISEIGAFVGLSLIIFSIIIFDNETPFPGLYTLVPVVGTVLVILFAEPATVVGKLLGHRSLVKIGLISYSAYLWHQPVFAFAKQRIVNGPDIYVLNALIVLSLVLAYFSWKYVETPFRDKNLISQKKIIVFSSVFSLFFVVTGLIGNYSGGLPDRMKEKDNLTGIELPKINNGWCFYSIDTISYLNTGDEGTACWIGDKSSDIRGVLFGDSFAAQYEPLWHLAAVDAKVSVNSITTNWCYPSVNDEYTGPLASRAFSQCLYNRTYLAENASSYDFAILSGDWGDVLKQGKLEGTLRLIQSLAPTLKLIVLMASPKQFDFDIMASFKKSIFLDTNFDVSRAPHVKDYLTLNAHKLLKEASDKYSNVLFVDRYSMFVVDGRLSDVTAENIPFSLDGAHISIYGSKQAAETFLKSSQFSEIKERLR